MHVMVKHLGKIHNAFGIKEALFVTRQKFGKLVIISYLLELLVEIGNRRGLKNLQKHIRKVMRQSGHSVTVHKVTQLFDGTTNMMILTFSPCCSEILSFDTLHQMSEARSSKLACKMSIMILLHFRVAVVNLKHLELKFVRCVVSQVTESHLEVSLEQQEINRHCVALLTGLGHCFFCHRTKIMEEVHKSSWCCSAR